MPATQGDSILGLPSTASIQALTPENYRQEFALRFPQGSFSLTGISSLISSNTTDGVTFQWPEQYYKQPKAKIRGTNPITSTKPASGDSDDGTALTNLTFAYTEVGTTDMYIKVANTRFFLPNQIVSLFEYGWQFVIKDVTRGTPLAPGSTQPSNGIPIDNNGYLTVRALRPYGALPTGTGYPALAAGLTLYVVASAGLEGGRFGSARGFEVPTNLANQTQIFPTAVKFTRSVLAVPTKFDETGIYQNKMKQAFIDHFTAIERAILFGQRSTTLVVEEKTGEVLPRRTLGGILEHLLVWNAGSNGITVDGQIYAPFQHDPVPSGPAGDADPNSRYIYNPDGLLTIARLNQWLAATFKYSSRYTNEKLCICGLRVALAFNEMVRRSGIWRLEESLDTFGLKVFRYVTPLGTLNIATHALFNEDERFTRSALFLNPWNLRLRPLRGGDTGIKSDVDREFDGRKDMIITELGLEVNDVSSFLYVDNINSYAEA